MVGGAPEKRKKVYSFSHRTGEESVREFYSNYKDMERSIQRNEHTKQPQTSYLYQIETLKLMPRSYGMVQHKGNEEVLNLSSYGLDSNYSKALASGLKLSQIKKVNIALNHLREPSTLNFIKALNKNVKEIDLSYNEVGLVSI